MNKFKVGDSVKYLGYPAYGGIIKGSIYTIKDILEEKLLLEGVSLHHYYDPKVFELYKDETILKFKLGDSITHKKYPNIKFDIVKTDTHYKDRGVILRDYICHVFIAWGQKCKEYKFTLEDEQYMELYVENKVDETKEKLKLKKGDQVRFINEKSNIVYTVVAADRNGTIVRIDSGEYRNRWFDSNLFELNNKVDETQTKENKKYTIEDIHIGDTVIMRDDLINSNLYGNISWWDKMPLKVTVTCLNNGSFSVEESIYIYTPEMIKEIIPKESVSKEIKNCSTCGWLNELKVCSNNQTICSISYVQWKPKEEKEKSNNDLKSIAEEVKTCFNCEYSQANSPVCHGCNNYSKWIKKELRVESVFQSTFDIYSKLIIPEYKVSPIYLEMMNNPKYNIGCNYGKTKRKKFIKLDITF